MKETAEWVTRDSLARALHATAPHGTLHPWDSCPQRERDYQDADEIRAVVRYEHAAGRWDEWARRLATLIHDGLIDTRQAGREIPDKAFYLARLLDEHLP